MRNSNLLKPSGLYAGLFGFVAMITASVTAMAATPEPWQMGLQAPAGSIAEKANDLHNLLLVIITAISVFVLALLIYTCLRFRESKNKVASKTTHNPLIEVLWTVIPVIILVVIAVPSFRLLYYQDRTDLADMVVKVTGAQWYWSYEYPDEQIAFDSYMIDDEDLVEGQQRMLEVDNPLVVPEGTKVKLLIEGVDVMHSFFVPSLAVQKYTVVGRTNETWIDVPMGVKTYYGQCNQICGTNHSYMPIVIKAVSAEDYKIWLGGAKEEFATGPIAPSAVELASV
ncbi:MAG: cytochrome c oxidase subunit II, partial [Pseudomonadota bacterium]|nr:cytochrome c oxidase subunit II [Pseudomonadota bacterium]